MSAFQSFPKCHDPRRCFAKASKNTCTRLNSTYPPGKRCPFRKAPEDMAEYMYMLMTGEERDAEIYRLKTEENKAADTIADLFGLSVTRVFEILDTQRKKRRKSTPSDENEAQIQKARELCAEGRTLSEISRIMNKPRSTLNTWRTRGII